MARAFVIHLSEGRFAEAGALLDPSPGASLTRRNVEQAWRDLTSRNGNLQGLGKNRMEMIEGFDVVILGLQLEMKAFDVQVVFNNENTKITGLVFNPAPDQKPALLPANYVDPATFVERDYEVDDGSFRLPGTLTLPKTAGPHAVVILIPGSGVTDRDETIGPNKPLRDIAWGLGTLGIASLRYDKRTFIYGQQLDTKTLTYEEEVVDDALTAIRQLRKDERIDKERMFILGHGLGGRLAPMIAQRARSLPGAPPNFFPTSYLAGVIIMAGGTRPLKEMVADQLQHIAQEDGEFSLQERNAILDFQAGISSLLAGGDDNSPPVMGISRAYLKALNEYDCLKTARRLDLPMLIAQGGRDYQVAAKRDFKAWNDTLAGEKKAVAFRLYPRLNHFFMAGDGPSYPSEYEEPGHVDEQFITDVSSWIRNIGYGH